MATAGGVALRRGGGLLACDVEDGVCPGLTFYHAEGFVGRDDDEFDVAAFGFALYFLHDWQATVRSCADDEALAFPGDLFFEGQGRVSKLVAEFLRG